MHRRFLSQYPEHREVDELSLADFLTAICLYDKIFIECSSRWNDRESSREGYEGHPRDMNIDGSWESWVKQLTRRLPKNISALITETAFNQEALIEEESIKKAFDTFRSNLKAKISLGPDETLPKVYYAQDYVYRQDFCDLNEAEGSPLSEGELAQAMFLHRGLFLQSHAHYNRCVYLPYHYRGKMLAQLPPMICVRTAIDSGTQARLPLAQGSRPDESEYLKAINEYYYSLLHQVTWTRYPNDVPFIGAAILATAKGHAKTALDIALEHRDKGVLRKRLAELDSAVDEGNRPRFESLMKAYRSELTAAARHFGFESDSPLHKAFYDLVIGWMPKGVESIVKAAALLVPESARHWAYEASTRLITATPMQMLFMQHVSAVRQAAS
jgi:hypothetical protein